MGADAFSAGKVLLAYRSDRGSFVGFATGRSTVAQLHFAQRLIVALLAISTSGLSVIAFPQLAGHLAASGRDVFARHFALATRRLFSS